MFSSRRIKIRVKADGVNINLPSLPLNSTVLRFAYWAAGHSKQLQQYNVKEFQDMIKPFFRELKDCPSFDLVDVKASDGTIVKIRII